jgi:hypothetical protein
MDLKRMVLGGFLSAATIVFVLGMLMGVGSVLSFGGTTTNTLQANVQVQKVCAITSVNNALINFVAIAPGGNDNTANGVTITDSGGNFASNILVAGGVGNYISPGNNIWIGSSASNTIGISNTLWNPSSVGTYSGNALSNTLTDTKVVLPAPTQASPSTTNVIYFGMGVPSGTPADTYTTNIILETTC